jgi:outer membrane protein assembly factor BamD (BamD/ComL family)
VSFRRDYVLPSFPEEGSVAIRGAEEPAEDRLFQLPQGTYKLRRGMSGTLEIEPQYRLQGWLTGLDIAFPLALAFSGVLTAHDAVYPKPAAVPITPSFSLSPATLTAYGVCLALIGFDITLHVLKARSMKSFRYTSVPARETLYQARDYFDRAESLLSLGQLEEAQRFYTLLLEQYKSSQLYPEALFKIARIHAITGDETMAEMELDLLIERYPTPELYDKARKALADLAFSRKEYRQSLEQLDALVFADLLFVPEEIDQYRAEILAAWAATDPTVLPRVLEAYEWLIDRYPASEEIPRYRFELAVYLHELDRDDEAAAQLELVEPDSVDSLLAERIRDLQIEIGKGR